ncbi:GMC family oxidoreductase [Providencia burhodogranariea]|uniref:FAD dependent oxidoreductase n=1 Tax=Providencia burhodogranariea DSM 19968 TaxID=1141662 RepID=K8WKZ9_9GAMM|nr:FAD dependent oxidoreductase [Providencia burhodogranariea DSM 19968]
MSENNSATVIIVGSGIAACQIAQKLAKQGIDTLMLEAGPRVKRWRVVEDYRNSPFKGDFQAPYKPTEYAPHPQYSPKDSGYLVQYGPEPYKAGYLRIAGGTTWHWSAQAWRLLPNDMKLQTLYGVGRDWPIGYDDLEPYYYEAEVEMGVGGPVDTGSPRSKPYPQPELPLSHFDMHFKKVVEPAGYYHITEPAARNTVAFDGRPACCGNSNCMPICPIEAQYTGETALRKAEAAGARLKTEAVVYQIEHDETGKISAVHYKDPNGNSSRVTGKIFVLAANAIETPKLMLISKSEKFKNGIGNEYDNVGRNLMDHPGTSCTFLSAEPVWPGRGPMRLSCINNLRDGEFRTTHSAIKINVGNYSPVQAVSTKLLNMGVSGSELPEMIRDWASRWVVINSFFDILPNRENRIVATGKKDKLGIPQPGVHYQIDDYIHKARDVAHEHYSRIANLFNAKPNEIWHDDNYFNNNHIMGTLMMGNDPRDSVVDADLRTFDHENLFVASSGVMASAGTVNCTLTLSALAMRLADKLVEEARHV